MLNKLSLFLKVNAKIPTYQSISDNQKQYTQTNNPKYIRNAHPNLFDIIVMKLCHFTIKPVNEEEPPDPILAEIV